jgi:putative ATP-binding cassette transporter
VRGRSGLGKSTFIRVIAGVWPYGSGEISLPEKNKTIMFLPQTSYMPLGSLRDAMLFPDKIQNVPDERLMELLKACDLSQLTSKLDEVAPWAEQLSPGELQRIAFIRVFIHKPDWVFLDESTSALDLLHEKEIYKLLADELPNCSIVSVRHRLNVEGYHDEEINLEAYGV